MVEGKTDRAAPLAARIHVIVAREAPYAVVIRRGPAKQVCTIGWDLRTDEFKLGQWLKGRIKERRCDLSPDGKHFIYFAFNGVWESETRGSWTAISRAPYLKAIGLWGNGSTWNGGGLFVSSREYWLNAGYLSFEMRLPHGLTCVPSHGGEDVKSGECPGVYYPHLMQNGWVVNEKLGPRNQWFRRAEVAVFEKPADDYWVLRKFSRIKNGYAERKATYYDEHEIEERSTGTKIDARDWEWADVVRGRLLWSRDGAIYSGRLTKEGIKDETMLKDFNSMQFERIKAPY